MSQREIKKAETVEELRAVILSLAASATLSDDMGDMWDDIEEALRKIGEDELAEADREYDEEDEVEGTASSEFSRMCNTRGIKTIWDTDI